LKSIQLSDKGFLELGRAAQLLRTEPDALLEHLVSATAAAVDAQPGQSEGRLISDVMNGLPKEGMISETPGVMGGVACIRDTRIAVWLLVSLRQQGLHDGEILRAFPFLDVGDLVAAWAYYGRNTTLIEAQILAQQEEDLVG